MGASSLAFLLASIGLTNVVASSLASEDASSPSKLSDRVATLCGAALLTLAACYGVKSNIRLTVVRTTVTAAVLLFTAIDYLLSIGQGLVRAARQHYRTFGASLAPGGATLAMPPRKPAVVVIGGSFAGLRVQRELGDDFDVTVVDLKDYFEYTPGVLRLYTQPERLTSLSAPLPCARNRLFVGEATAVTSHVVKLRLTNAGDCAEEIELPCALLASSQPVVSTSVGRKLPRIALGGKSHRRW